MFINVQDLKLKTLETG